MYLPGKWDLLLKIAEVKIALLPPVFSFNGVKQVFLVRDTKHKAEHLKNYQDSSLPLDY